MLQRRWRRLLLAFVGIALPLSAFSELAEEIHEADPLGFDEPLLRWAEASASPSLDQAMLLASELGYAWGVVPLAVLVFAGLLVAGRASLDDLNQRLQAAGRAAVDMRRFRPNIVLGGLAAYDEDRSGPMTITTADGEAVIAPVKPCARCPIPDIDPDTAERGYRVSDTLQTYRQDPRVGGAVTFGMNAIVTTGDGMVLREGQPVRADLRFD